MASALLKYVSSDKNITLHELFTYARSPIQLLLASRNPSSIKQNTSQPIFLKMNSRAITSLNKAIQIPV